MWKELPPSPIGSYNQQERKTPKPSFGKGEISRRQVLMPSIWINYHSSSTRGQTNTQTITTHISTWKPYLTTVVNSNPQQKSSPWMLSWPHHAWLYMIWPQSLTSLLMPRCPWERSHSEASTSPTCPSAGGCAAAAMERSSPLRSLRTARWSGAGRHRCPGPSLVKCGESLKTGSSWWFHSDFMVIWDLRKINKGISRW